MTPDNLASGLNATPDLPLPRLVEGRFSNLTAYTDEGLFSASGVRIAFSERNGGISLPPYDSLNLGTHVSDGAAAVASNRAALLRALGAEDAQVICPNQVHGADVAICTCTSAVDDARDFAQEGADAVVVSCDDVAALLCFADCMPVVLVAPGGAFSVVHCGWRGVVGGVWQHAALALEEASGQPISRFNAYIGPYIHSCHFEVGEEVANQFNEQFGADCLVDARHVDMGCAIQCALQALGFAPERIADVDVCTVCDGKKRFYSYRASGGVCGRHGALAVKTR